MRTELFGCYLKAYDMYYLLGDGSVAGLGRSNRYTKHFSYATEGGCNLPILIRWSPYPNLDGLRLELITFSVGRVRSGPLVRWCELRDGPIALEHSLSVQTCQLQLQYAIQPQLHESTRQAHVLLAM